MGAHHADSAYDHVDATAVAAQFDRVIDTLAAKLPAVADHLDQARGDPLAFTAFPKEIWRPNLAQQPARTAQLARPGHTVRIAGATQLSFMNVPFLPHVDGAVVASMLAATTIDPARRGD